MAHRDIKKDDFVGKTITDLDCEAVNIIRFTFEDGSRVALEVEAVAPGIYGMVACDACAPASTPPARERTQSTTIAESALDNVVKLWTMTACPSLGKDLYLALVSAASCIPYNKCVALFKEHDDGIIQARRYVKRKIFGKLINDPSSVLRIHDEVIVREGAPVESADVQQELAHRGR